MVNCSCSIKAGRILGPFYTTDLFPPVHISRCGVIPKGHQGDKWRVIVDLSAPDGYSINDGIRPDICSLEYTRVSDAVKVISTLGPGTLLAKIDVKSAYRIVPVHPADRHMLGVKWRQGIFVDTALPIGLRSAPKIFNAVADALHWILQKHGVSHLWHYLDDFLTAGRAGSAECSHNRQIIATTCELLGIPLASEKCVGPQTCLTFLGLELDTVQAQVRLPKDKLRRLGALVQQWEGKRSCTKHELDSLIGQLHHASTVVRPGRSFLRRMITLSKAAGKPWQHIRLNASFRADLAWWKAFLAAWNGVSMMKLLGHQEPAVVVTSDASGHWGCGAFCERKWFQLQWDPTLSQKSIAAKELIPIVVACAVWGPTWEGQVVRCRSDNQTVVAVIQTRYSRDDDLMHLLRSLFFFEAVFGCQIIATYIPGAHNSLADDLSRDKLCSFLSKVPGAETEPTPLPGELIHLLQAPHLDWTSESWTRLFSIILTKV